MVIELTRQVISPAQVEARVHKDSHGAVVTFLGVVRDNYEGKAVHHLEYEAYPPMAEAKLTEIATQIKERWGLGEVAIVHRLGRLEIGEVIIAIAVGAPHRREAFQACQFAIDRLKETVPIWKKEFFADGSRWVEG